MGLGLGYLPILAVQTSEIAPGGGQGKCLYAGFEMEKGFFFYGICVHRTRIAVSQAKQFAVIVDFGSAHTAVSRRQDATVRANATGDPITFQLSIKITLVRIFPEFFRRITFKYFAADVLGNGGLTGCS